MEENTNTENVIKYLSRAFAKAAFAAHDKLGNKAVRTQDRNGKWVTTTLYDYQVDFCYHIKAIQSGDHYVAMNNIRLANELISRVEAEK